MSVKLPEEYIIQKIYTYGIRVKKDKHNNTYLLECNACREGKSRGKKRRLYYMEKEEYFYCHNCQRSWNPINWIKEVSGMSFQEIMDEVKLGSFSFTELMPEKKATIITATLPDDSINLFDRQQVKYYLKDKVVVDALKFIQKRRLHKAINRPKSLYISLKDFIHKNRICIPFYDENNKIQFYQTRAIYKSDEMERPKYLSKQNSDKTLYGINNIDTSLDTLFIFEGPIDSMFVKNGLAMGGISTTEKQEEQLEKYRLMNKIWILDNQLDNKQVKKRVTQLVEKGESVFFWPEKYKQFKDLNELCVKLKINKVSGDFFIKNSFSGMEALLKLK